MHASIAEGVVSMESMDSMEFDKISEQDTISKSVINADAIQTQNPAEKEDSSAGNKNGGLDTEVIVALIGVGSLFLTGLGWVIKSLWDSKQKKIEREKQMITSVTKNIEDLASKYYWLLANHSRVLGGLLKEYLNKREELQLPIYSNAEEVKTAFNKLTDTYSLNAFYYYSRLIKTIYEFQWVAGNTYFLNHYWAGEALTNLYNGLQHALQDQEPAIDSNRIVEVIDKNVDVPGGMDTLHSYNKKINAEDNKELKIVYSSFHVWLSKKIHRVYEASSCLDAYSSLLKHELGILYLDWFRDKSIDSEIFEWHLKDVPTLDEKVKATILHVGQKQLTMQPIGKSVDTGEELKPVEPDTLASKGETGPDEKPKPKGPDKKKVRKRLQTLHKEYEQKNKGKKKGEADSDSDIYLLSFVGFIEARYDRKLNAMEYEIIYEDDLK